MNGFGSAAPSPDASPVARRPAAHDLLPEPTGTRWAVRYTHGADTQDVTGTVTAADAEALNATLGARSSLHLLLDDPAPSSSATVVVAPEDRAPVTVPLASVQAAREIPPRPVLPASSALKLQRLMVHGLPGVETARLGGWLLRWGHGITARANAVLPMGDPAGLSLGEALDVAEEWYALRHHRAHVQVPMPVGALDLTRPGHEPEQLTPAWRQPDLTGKTDGGTHLLHPELEGVLQDRGYTRILPAAVMVSDVGRTRDLWDAAYTRLPAHWSVSWSDASSDGLLMGPTEHFPPRFHDVMNSAPARYLVIRDEQGVVGRGRLSLDQPGWCGVYNLRVRDDVRGQGLGAPVMGALLHEAARYGAKYAYLQVVTTNVPALRLYRSLGWQLHHGYTMWGGPRPDPSDEAAGCGPHGTC